MSMQVKKVGNKVALNGAKNNTEFNGLKAVATLIFAKSPLTKVGGYLMTAKGGHYSPFGHGNGVKNVNRIATNAQIDHALCQGHTMLNTLIHSNQVPSRNCDRANEADLGKRPEMSNVYNDKFTIERVIDHLAFLAGKNNGKNSLQKRLHKALPTCDIFELNAIAQKVHAVAAPMLLKAERAFNAKYNKNQHKYADYVSKGVFGVELTSISQIM